MVSSDSEEWTQVDNTSQRWSENTTTLLGPNLLIVNNTEATESTITLPQLQIFFLALSILCGLGLNVFVLVAIVPNRRIRSTITNVLLCHLAATNLAICGLLLWRLVYVSLDVPAGQGRGIYCQIQGCLTSLTSQLSIWTLAALAWDRYQTISSPLHHRTSTSKKRMSIFLGAIWVIAIVLSLLPVIFGPGYEYRGSLGYCEFPFSAFNVISVSVVYLLATFYGPCGVIIYCYAQIFKIARWQRQRIVTMVHLVTLSIQAPITHRGTPSSAVSLKSNRASWTICVLLGAFLTCYLPYFVSSLIEVATSSTRHPLLRMWVVILLHLAPAVNATVYGIRNKVLRDSFLRNVHRKLTEYAIPVPFPKPKPSLPNALQHAEHFRAHRLPSVRSQPVLTMHRINSEEEMPCLIPKAHSLIIARQDSPADVMLELCSVIPDADTVLPSNLRHEDNPDDYSDVIVKANGHLKVPGANEAAVFQLETLAGFESKEYLDDDTNEGEIMPEHDSH